MAHTQLACCAVSIAVWPVASSGMLECRPDAALERGMARVQPENRTSHPIAVPVQAARDREEFLALPRLLRQGGECGGAPAALWKAGGVCWGGRAITPGGGRPSPSHNCESGLGVGGFGRPRRFLLAHTPPYYGRLLEAWGLRKARDLYAFT